MTDLSPPRPTRLDAAHPAPDPAPESAPEDALADERRDTILSAITVAGMALAALATWVVPQPALAWTGIVLVYLAGGIPPAVESLTRLVREREIDIDLLMVIAALAAAAVGGALEGGVLLTLFSISGTLETRAMGKARRAVEALMALRPDTALRLGLLTEVVPRAELRDRAHAVAASIAARDTIAVQGTVRSSLHTMILVFPVDLLQ